MVSGRSDSGVLHAVRFCHGGNRVYPGKECRKHHHEKPDGFLYRDRCLHLSRLRPDDGRPRQPGSHREARVGDVPELRRLRLVFFCFPACLLCHSRHHRFRCDGGKDEVLRILPLFRDHQPPGIPGRSWLGLGRRMAQQASVYRFCRFLRDPYGWGTVGACGRDHSRPQNREVQQEPGRNGKVQRDPWTFRNPWRAGLLHPVVRVVRLQRGRRGGRVGNGKDLRHDDHRAGSCHRYLHGADLEEEREAGRLHVPQRVACGPGCHHGGLCQRGCARRVCHRGRIRHSGGSGR